MDGLQGNYQINTQEPSFQGRRYRQELTITPPEQIENGDKKLKNALIALGATAAAGVVLYKTGALAKAKDLISKKGTQATQNTSSAIQKGSKEAIEASQKNIQGVAQEAQEAVNKHKDEIAKIASDNNIISNQQKTIDKLKQEIIDIETDISYAQKAGDKTSKLEGRRGNLIGDLRQQEATLKELQKNTSTQSIQEAGQKLSDLAKTDAQVKGVVDMQRAARKHPGLSDKALASIQQTSSEAAKNSCEFQKAFTDYNAKLEAKGKPPVDIKKFEQLLLKRLAM